MRCHTTGSMFSPNNVLPMELWSIIFSYTLSSPDTFVIRDRESLAVKLTDPQNTPIVLSSVCRLWRTITCNLPRLWSTCWLSYENTELNRIWLDRAGKRGLKLLAMSTWRIRFCWGADRRASATYAFLKSILPYCKQWQHVKFDIRPLYRAGEEGSNQVEADACLALLEGLTSPILETFDLYNGNSIEFKDPALSPLWVPRILSNAPNLGRLNVPNLVGYISVEVLKGPLLNVVDLEIGRMTCEHAALLMIVLPQLRTFKVQAGGDEENAADRTPDLIHRLTEFQFVNDYCLDEEMVYPSLLHFVKLPFLRSLQLTTGSVDEIISFLDRSKCCLSELKIIGEWLDPFDITLILDHLSVDYFLKSLEFEDVEITTELLVDFLEFDPTLPVLASLEKLSFKHCDFNFREGELSRCIASRCGRYWECDHPRFGPVWGKAELKELFISGLYGDFYVLDVACIIPLEQPTDRSKDSGTGELHLLQYRNDCWCERGFQFPIEESAILLGLDQAIRDDFTDSE